MQCPHCGESVDRGLATRHPYVWHITIAGMLFPPIALILGIVFVTRTEAVDRDLGVQLLWIFVILAIIAPALIFLMISQAAPP